jgi:Chaperone of endosialidase
MKIGRIFPVLILVGVSGVEVASGQEASQEAIPNWPAPATWSPHSASRGVSTMAAITSPIPFIGLAPCRIVDTRGNGAPIQGGIFPGGGLRNYAVAGICGIPASAEALSLNFTITGPGQTVPGFLTAWPTNGAVPPVSILNWDHVPAQIANAAVVATGTSTSITVNVSAPTHVIIDVNGYYAGAGVGTSNTFLGVSAGASTLSGDSNTAIGAFALCCLNPPGDYNTAIGSSALRITAGSRNSTLGSYALTNMSTGSDNIGIGYFAGQNHFTGDHNIYIGNAGVNGESNTIRIGDASFQDGGTIITGISGLTATGGAPVYVTGGGRLGTVTSSSRRFKQEIRDIAGESDRLMRLRPVAFRYKPEFDPTGELQYGLIAEEVAEVYPDLVTLDREGRPEGVRYHLIAPLLLNEVQKQRRTIESQQGEIEELKARLAALEARLLGESRP